MRHWFFYACMAASPAVTLSCLSPAEQRVGMDEAVGQQERAGLEVRVVDGLAAVRHLDGERVELFASAPSLDVELLVEEARTVVLQIGNIVPGSRLLVEDGIRGVDLEPKLPTQLRRELQLSAGPHRLRLRAPDADSGDRFSIGVLSDVQEAIDTVGDIYALINSEPDLDFLLGAGDLTEQGTSEQLTHFERELESLNIPYYTTLGNHELGVDPPVFHERFGRGSRSFEHKRVRFTLLDSASATLDPAVYDWLEGWLVQGRRQLHVVGMHIPPVDPSGTRNGSFASRAEANKPLSRLSQGAVDLTLYGHVHSFYDFNNGGIQAYISGGGGAIPEKLDNIGRHFLVIDMTPGEQSFRTRVVRVD